MLRRQMLGLSERPSVRATLSPTPAKKQAAPTDTATYLARKTTPPSRPEPEPSSEPSSPEGRPPPTTPQPSLAHQAPSSSAAPSFGRPYAAASVANAVPPSRPPPSPPPAPSPSCPLPPPPRPPPSVRASDRCRPSAVRRSALLLPPQRLTRLLFSRSSHFSLLSPPLRLLAAFAFNSTPRFLPADSPQLSPSIPLPYPSHTPPLPTYTPPLYHVPCRRQ